MSEQSNRGGFGLSGRLGPSAHPTFCWSTPHQQKRQNCCWQTQPSSSLPKKRSVLSAESGWLGGWGSIRETVWLRFANVFVCFLRKCAYLRAEILSLKIFYPTSERFRFFVPNFFTKITENVHFESVAHFCTH